MDRRPRAPADLQRGRNRSGPALLAAVDSEVVGCRAARPSGVRAGQGEGHRVTTVATRHPRFMARTPRPAPLLAGLSCAAGRTVRSGRDGGSYSTAPVGRLALRCSGFPVVARRWLGRGLRWGCVAGAGAGSSCPLRRPGTPPSARRDSRRAPVLGGEMRARQRAGCDTAAAPPAAPAQIASALQGRRRPLLVEPPRPRSGSARSRRDAPKSRQPRPVGDQLVSPFRRPRHGQPGPGRPPSWRRP